jgi:hypothetical protein
LLGKDALVWLKLILHTADNLGISVQQLYVAYDTSPNYDNELIISVLLKAANDAVFKVFFLKLLGELSFRVKINKL